jgi:hypothetical protein
MHLKQLCWDGALCRVPFAMLDGARMHIKRRTSGIHDGRGQRVPGGSVAFSRAGRVELSVAAVRQCSEWHRVCICRLSPTCQV